MQILFTKYMQIFDATIKFWNEWIVWKISFEDSTFEVYIIITVTISMIQKFKLLKYISKVED